MPRTPCLALLVDGRRSMNNRENWATHWQTVTTPDTLPSWIQWFLSKAWERLCEYWNPVSFYLFFLFFFFSWSFPSTHPEPHGMLSSWCFTDFCTQSCPNSPDFWSQCRYGLLLQWKPVKSALDEKAALKEGKWTSSAGGKVSNRGSSLLLALQWVRLFILPTTSIYLVCTAVPRNPWVHFPWFHLPAVNHIPKILNENYQK